MVSTIVLGAILGAVLLAVLFKQKPKSKLPQPPGPPGIRINSGGAANDRITDTGESTADAKEAFMALIQRMGRPVWTDFPIHNWRSE